MASKKTLPDVKGLNKRVQLLVADLAIDREPIEGRNQAAIAAELGITAKHLSQCKSGRAKPSQLLIVALEGLQAERDLELLRLRLEAIKDEVRNKGNKGR